MFNVRALLAVDLFSVALIDEMTVDLRTAESKYAHQLAVLPNRGVIYSPDKDQFTYYESEHEDLLNQISILQVAGFIVAVRESAPPVFRMSEEFMRLLKGEQPGG